MTDSVVIAGRYVLHVKSSPTATTSFFWAIAEQNHDINNLISNPDHLMEVVKRTLTTQDFYNHNIGCIQSPEVIRLVSQYLKTAIEIYHPDGHRITYPYHFNMNEPVFRIFLDGVCYQSIEKVRNE